MVTRLFVTGNERLSGTVRIGGHKNAVVALIPAALLATTPSRFENVPDIGDVRTWLRLLAQMGVRTRNDEAGRLTIDGAQLVQNEVPRVLASRIRASYYLLGVLLGRYGRASVPLPGGCNLGQRPIDQHLKGFEALGADVMVDDDTVHAAASNGLRGADIQLDVVSVGATINLMFAAVLAKGVTRISNAAREPHVRNVAEYLNSMGARITGVGSSQLTVRGVSELTGTRHTVIPDDIEATTYLLASAATGGSVRVTPVVPQHLRPVLKHLHNLGVPIRTSAASIQVGPSTELRSVDLTTDRYPGFPTDAHPLFVPALCRARGTSRITETVWPERFSYVEPMRTMGAEIRTTDSSCTIAGMHPLHSASVGAQDLRTGAALVISGLAAKGTTVIDNFATVERGYERMDTKLRGLGADVQLL